MSATLDTAPVAKYLGDCPQVASPGRTFPLEIEYLQFPANEPLPQLCFSGVKKMLARREGHILVFLPGIAEIRQTQGLLDQLADEQDIRLLPLYGEMPLEEQQSVLEPSERRKVILATNVAETSLTIDGVTCVIDGGMMRVNQLDARLGLNRLQLSKISKASANQRAGRAARTAPGVCLRLWSEREHQMLSEFQAPEITRVELSQCLLQLLAWGEKDLAAFPWFEPPPAQTSQQAMQLLERLDAIDSSGQLTELGKDMSKLPVQPRIARLLIEGKRYGVTPQAAVCAALLSERDPFRRKETGEIANHHSNSDVLDRVLAIEEFAKNGSRHSLAGELIVGPARQILKASDQLMSLAQADKESRKGSAGPRAEEYVLRSLLAAFPDRVCKRRDSKGKRAVMVGGRGARVADSSAVDRADLFLAVELLDTGQSELLVTQASQIEREWLPPSHLSSVLDCLFDSDKERVIAFKKTKFIDLTIDELQVPVPKNLDASAILVEAVKDRGDLENFVDEEGMQYLYRVQSLRKWLPALNFPDFGSEPLKFLLPFWCEECTSVQDLKSKSLIPVIQSQLSHDQQYAIEHEAPARIEVPSGSKIKVQYRPDEAPVVAVRIQEVFGMRETPRIAQGRIPILLHLLAPNYQVQQITPDLMGFWKNTYQDVKKDFRRRYPKHSWPDDPLTAQAERRPQRKKSN
jgi:ATP-dependent helicase HrpB